MHQNPHSDAHSYTKGCSWITRNQEKAGDFEKYTAEAFFRNNWQGYVRVYFMKTVIDVNEVLLAWSLFDNKDEESLGFSLNKAIVELSTLSYLETRAYRSALLNVLNKHQQISFSALSSILYNNLSKLTLEAEGRVVDENIPELPEYDSTQMLQLYEEILKSTRHYDIASYEINIDVNDDSELSLLSFIFDMFQCSLSQYSPDESAEEDMKTSIELLAIGRSLALKYNLQDRYYLATQALFQRLNLLSRFQIARDISEGVLEGAIGSGNNFLGWLSQFRLYTSQYNPVHAALCGCVAS